VRIVAMCHCCPFEKAGRMPESERKKKC
jgi:hypothetical protein